MTATTSTSSAQSEISGAKRRIVDRLKRSDGATAPEMAAEFGLTDTAVRQHLEALEAAGLVERTTAASAPTAGRGRPPVFWRTTSLVDTLFADRHADLTVELIASIREALGDEALPPDPVVGDDLPGSGPAELAISLLAPVHVYPLLEVAHAHRLGRDSAAQRQAILAAGISEAMNATAFGLVTAIGTMVAQS